METISKKKGIYEKYFKRFLDVVCAGIAIIVLSPIFLIIAALVRDKLGAPVVFKQERPGLHGQVFQMYKFRTMLSPQTRDDEY